MPRSTLIRSPAGDPSISPIENVLELTELYEFGPVSRPLLQSVYFLLPSRRRIYSPTHGQHITLAPLA